MNEIDFLAKVPIFNLMKKEDLERISKILQLQTFEAGDIIIQEGDTDKRLFMIVQGRVEVVKYMGTKKETPIGVLGPLNYFGEMALIDDLERSASVVAREHTRIFMLGQWDLLQEIKNYPEIAIELLQMLTRRVRILEMTLMNTLGTFLTVCSKCRKIREKDGEWTSMERYISEHSATEFSHGICPDCVKELYPELAKKGDKNPLLES